MPAMENKEFTAEACTSCGTLGVTHSVQTQQFAYAEGHNEVLLTAQIPVIECAACGEAYTGADAEEIQHEAVCRYLGRMTPAEIRELRRRHTLTQAKLAERTGIGIASIKRWEAGSLIQNASLDAQLRALDAAAAKIAPRPQSQFQTQLRPEMWEEQKAFRLRPLQAA